MHRHILIFSLIFLPVCCANGLAQDTLNFPHIGEVIRKRASFDQLVAPDAKIEVLASGFLWAEGPVWVKDGKHDFGGFLLFSDIPNNRIVRWDEGLGAKTWMKPSGFTGVGEYSPESGCNGLTLDAKGQLISCEHGDRRVSLLTKGGGKMTLADKYNGKRLNSPNDVVVHPNGSVYFTDPPYGLPKRYESPERELDFCGVYRLAPSGKLTLLTKEMTRPNGIAFSPDFKRFMWLNRTQKRRLSTLFLSRPMAVLVLQNCSTTRL